MESSPGDDTENKQNEANSENELNDVDDSKPSKINEYVNGKNAEPEQPLLENEAAADDDNADGGLLIVDMSERIAKGEESDNSESADDLLNDAVYTKGRKRKASELDGDSTKQNESTLDSSNIIHTDKDESTLSESDLGGSLQKQTLGKGKRARIPNKRYSDILLSPNRSKSIENGEKMEIDEKEPVYVATPPVQRKGNKPMHIDRSNPMFLKPFELGWKRELVYRANSDGPKKTTGDVYYYTPSGRKVRSMREISEIVAHLDDLSVENFVFLKEPVGVDDPEKEIIRDAKRSKKLQNKGKSKNLTPRSLPRSGKLLGNSDTESETAVKSQSKSASKGLGFKIKAPSKKGKEPKQDDNVDTDDSMSKVVTSRKSSRYSNKSTTDSPTRNKKHILKLTNNQAPESREESKFMANYLQNLAVGYKTMQLVFQYLKIQDLGRCSRVCTMWHDMANKSSLWQTVRMKNSQVLNFDSFSNALKKHGTVQLDLRKMLLTSGGDEIWTEFSEGIKKVDTLKKIEFCRCPASVVEQMPISNPNLEVINAVVIKCESFSLESFASLHEMRELRLKSTQGMRLTSDIDTLVHLKKLSHLSLTSIREFNKLNLNVIGDLVNLESLELGEFTDFPENFGRDILAKLVNLEKLRLEKGQGKCHTFEILETIKDMPKIEQLELVNFDIKHGFDKALGGCKSVKKLLIIPTYISQSATTNHMVLGGVLRLKESLSHFVWGVTLELLRVTELFIDQCDEPAEKKDKKDKKKAMTGDSIPVLKPVPLLNDKNEIEVAIDPPEVEILPLPNLQKLLLQSLPTTRVKILKIPFHATWRQSITDSVN